MRGVNFSAKHKKQALKMWLNDGANILDVCAKFNCTERSLWRWKSIYDGTVGSLEPKTSRVNMFHPNMHTDAEKENIVNIFKQYPNIKYNEAYKILQTKYGYSRSFGGFYSYVRRHNLRQVNKLKN